MIATVVGPEGEAIFCDEYGRVKIHFSWDRYSKRNEHSSCWVRVSQGWAGGQYGIQALPRIGHEVIVEFLNGDPDQPIITGRTHHAVNIPPYPLLSNKTKTVLRTSSHQGEGFNELSFEDQADNEKVYLHAQKDVEAKVNHNSSTRIKHDKHLMVDNDSFTEIKRHQHLTITGEKRTKVSQDRSEVVEGSIHQKIGRLHALDSGNEVHIKAGNKIVLDAGSELTLQAGGSFIRIDAAGACLVGSAIRINSGGSAGSSSGFAGKDAVLPHKVLAMKSPQETISPELASRQIQVLKERDPVCEVCGETESNG